MNNIQYLEWFTNRLEEHFDAYSSAHGSEKEGRKEGIKNFIKAQKEKLDKIINIKEFSDAMGTSFSWGNLIEPYFFDSNIKEFIRQLKSN